MNNIKFRHQFMDPDEYSFDPPEINSGEVLVETAGYIPPQKQIEAMIHAGIVLENSRSSMYDSDDPDFDEDFFDPTRKSGFDMADASILAEAMLERAHSKNNEQKNNDEQKVQEENIPPAPLPKDDK